MKVRENILPEIQCVYDVFIKFFMEIPWQKIMNSLGKKSLIFYFTSSLNAVVNGSGVVGGEQNILTELILTNTKYTN